MSIKKLFGSTDKPNKYLSDTTEKEAFQEIESARNLKALSEKQNTYVPQVDYSDPASFAKYGSAYLYYKSSMERVADFFPYDGSDAEINEYHNKSLDIDKYIFNNLYPRTNGYIHISSDGWGTLSGSKYSGFGLPSSLEYIDFKGGPNTITASNAAALFGNPNSSNTNTANIYDTDIYTTAKLPSNFGSGSRESNLKSNFDDGVTVEFWAKTGSLGAALTNKQVFVDIWNNEVSSSAYGGSVGANPNPVYGRITIAYQVPLERFVITAQSGSTGIFEQKIGTSLTGSLSDWKHYAVSFYNSGSSFITNLHVDGKLNDSNSIAGLNVNEINSKNMVGRIGALLSSPSGAAGSAQQTQNMVGAGKLSGSLDEFRFWKAYRNSHEIAKHYFTQVRGGANTDISNTTLGLYYKFNEGITGTSTTDSVVLDYSGRISNGTWTGYSTTSRNTGSAIISASAAGVEYEDPIIRTNHSDVTSLKKALLDSGSYHDNTSISSMLSMIPSWIVEEQEKAEDGNVQVMSHIIGAYFDKLHLMITALPKFNSQTHTSASYTPLAFAQHLPQSLGLYTPEIFVDSDVLERFMNRNQTMLFEGDLIETKNLIYLNLYNNLTNIYKSKGTEKSIRNVFRCFNVDEKVLRFNTYAHNATYELKDNFQQTLINKPLINLNKKDNLTAVIYQAADAANGESLGYISGSNGAGDPGGAGGGNDAYEDKYGFTAESSVIFPKFNQIANNFDRNYADVSLFGMYTVNTGSANSLNGTDTTFVDEDFANFQVMAVKDKHLSKNVYFKLTSSISPYSFPELTSSTFFNVYDDNHWNFSVRLKPSNYPLTDIVTGSEGYTYDVIFKGINTFIGTIQDSFTLTGSVSKEVGRNILRSAKRLYAGARRTNVTGNVLQYSDVLFSNVKYWTKYLDDSSIERHLYDFENRGVSGSYQPTSPRDANIKNVNILNLNTLALDWNFENVTSSNTDGTFVVTDMSSGSALIRDNYGWIGKVAGYQHTGYGKSFATSSSDVITKEAINVFKYIDPEKVVSSDMVQILTEDDKVFGTPDSIPSYRYTLEKSMHNAISEEMLKFFAGAVDFNNVIGEPVNRYRAEYKTLRKLREIFFRKVVAIKDVEDYIDYYKWFDDSLAQIIGQLLPASSDFESDVFNTIESHVLERNKYETKFPTLEFKATPPEASFEGIGAKLYPPRGGATPTGSGPLDNYVKRKTNINEVYWKNRAERDSVEITSGDSTVDAQRLIIRDIVASVPAFSRSFPTLSSIGGVKYLDSKFRYKQLVKLYNFEILSPFSPKTSFFKGGMNFEQKKSLQFTYTALYPFGPVNRTNSVFVPKNVLFAHVSDLEGLKETHLDNINSSSNPSQKTKRYFKVQHGRDWEEGGGYSNVKSSFSFPFNVMSSSVKTGFNKIVVDRVTGGIEITNLHHDAYGADLDIPMQGNFTNYAVGGHQSRHVPLNTGSDDYTNRPEAWKILLDTCGAIDGITGAIGMVGADYPWPEANAVGANPYPMTASQKAVYYRDGIAKRPVNIRNIHHTTGAASAGGTGSTILGNYNHQYDIVSTQGAYSNPRRFVEQQPTLPAPVLSHFTGVAARSSSTNVINNFINLHRGTEGHFDFNLTYAPTGISGSDNKSVMINRFSNPGGIEVMSRGFQNLRDGEFSQYNSTNYRNLTVIKPHQGSRGTISEPTGTEGGPSIRVYDIHSNDYGLRSHLSRHTGKFGRDSLIYPVDELREPYNLNKPFIGYSGVETYRTTGSLQGWWRLNENVSSAPNLPADSSTKGRTGAFDAADDRPDFSSSAFPSRYVQTSSCGFSGDADGVNIGAAGTWNAIIGSAAASTKKMTFSAWIYKVGDGGGNYGRILEFGDGDVRFYTNNVESIYFDVTAWSGANAQWHATSPFSLTTWTHVAVTYDATSTNNNPIIYVNGIAKTVTEDTAPAGTYGAIATNACYIGNRSDAARGFNGQISDVAVWNSILSPEEIKAIYNASKLPTLAGPGVSADQFPGFHKTHRNSFKKGRLSSSVGIFENGTVLISSSYDNFYVQHPIPRSDRQYSWYTSSLAPGSTDLRYYGYMPLKPSPAAGYYSGSDGKYVSFFNFVSASAVGDVQTKRAVNKNFAQPTVGRLNILTVDPVSGGTDNIIGFTPVLPWAGPTRGADDSLGPDSSYFNSDVLNNALYKPHLNPLSSSVVGNRANYFNLLMTRRGNSFGWSWQRILHQYDNPILIQERKNNRITMITGSDQNLVGYRLTPVSMKGRPTLINFQLSSDEDITLKVTDNNNKIFFEETAMNNLIIESTDGITTPYDQLLPILQENYSINWIVYSEALYPSTYNEFFSSSIQRSGYNNGFWRDNRENRADLGNTLRNAFNTRNVNISQSSWVLDAPKDFLTRGEPATWRNGGLPIVFQLSGNASAGTLQNIYSHCVPTSSVLNAGGRVGYPIADPNDKQRFGALVPMALYARKHTNFSPSSVTSPQGVRVAETGSNPTQHSNQWNTSFHVELFAGEALWEAGTQAGIITSSVSSQGTTKQALQPGFQSIPSEPWFDKYSDYNNDMKLIAKDYSIIPEFRISEHIEDYVNYGLFASTKTDTFGIPGTHLSSSQSTFYKDYSNSDFMNNFLNIKEDSLLNATEIRLVCSAAIRFHPYKGFYPAQRTVDLVSQFSKSYGSGFFATSSEDGVKSMSKVDVPTPDTILDSYGGMMRPLTQTLFAPGILYNSIKSGLAVDYPVITDEYKIKKEHYGHNSSMVDGGADETGVGFWALAATSSLGGSGRGCPISGAYWDQRLPFETIIEPEKRITDLNLIDIEPHPSASLNVTASLLGGTYDDIYTRMASNFFGEIGNFFLKDKEFTKLRSGVVSDNLKFKAGSSGGPYGARIKLKRSKFGSRNYQFESGAYGGSGSPAGYSKQGGAYYDTDGANFLTSSYFPIPQDPRVNLDYKESFTMYSRPSAFGPPIAGRPWGTASFFESTERTHPLDCFNGFYGAHTPPYYDGEAWADIIFKPVAGTEYDLETILAECAVIYWRVDPGVQVKDPSDADQRPNTVLVSSFPQKSYDSLMVTGTAGAGVEFRSFYGGKTINHNIMQLSASFNLFGVEAVTETETNKFGTTTKQINKTVGSRWVIQPKFETPMLNFNDEGVHPITEAAGNLTIPTFGSASVPRGMWHQFGIIEPDSKKGIFIEIDDIPTAWLRNHYDVVQEDSIYNLDDAAGKGETMYQKYNSLTDLLGFTSNNSKVRLGELAETQTLREAIVAVPYILNTSGDVTGDINAQLSATTRSTSKEFFEIPEERLTAAKEETDGSLVGDSLDAAGESIRKLIQKMDRYILPPQFDFLNNDSVTPIVMYMFEFEYKLDRDDLSYIWQNLAPRNYKDMKLETQSVAHELINTELLDEDNIMDNENLRWMVFKVKQRGQTNYWDEIASQVNRANASAASKTSRGKKSRQSQKQKRQETSEKAGGAFSKRSEGADDYELNFNWPYDYVSFVEMVKIDAEVLYEEETIQEKNDTTASEQVLSDIQAGTTGGGGRSGGRSGGRGQGGLK